MGRHKSSSAQSSGQATATSQSDTKHHIGKLETKLGKVRELMQDGIPYLDALKVKVELGIKETVKDIFGPSSQEYQVLRKHTIDITDADTIEKTAAILQGLINYFEYQQQHHSDKKNSSVKTPLEYATAAQQALEQSKNPPPPPSKPSTATRAATSKEPQQKKSKATVTSPPAKSKSEATPPAPAPKKKEKVERIEPVEAELNLPSLPPSMTAEIPPAPIEPVARVEPEVQTPLSPEPPVSYPTLNVHNQQFLEKPHTLTTPPAPQGNQPMTTSTPMPQTTNAPESPSITSNNSLGLIRKICQRFHTVIRQLRERSEDRPPVEIEDEHDVRDILRALLYLEFDDVGIEEWVSPSPHGMIQRDFLVQPGNLVIFVTKTRAGLGTKEITDLWTSACSHYASHLHCQHLVGFIYDPEGRIANPRRLEETLATQGGTGKVEIQIFPK